MMTMMMMMMIMIMFPDREEKDVRMVQHMYVRMYCNWLLSSFGYVLPCLSLVLSCTWMQEWIGLLRSLGIGEGEEKRGEGKVA